MFDGAIIREQGVVFAIAKVRSSALHTSEREVVQSEFAAFFRVPTVLCAQDSRGIPTYYGRPDLVRFLQNVHISRIPWRRYHT